jgi:hypothetical protein
VIALAGDSIFDNIAYTRGEPDVAAHLRALVAPRGVALVAVDGAVTRDVARQLRHVPAEATHIALSVGGNDALGNYDLLNTALRSTGEALALFARRIETFERDYRAALQSVIALERQTAICTIYNGDLGPAEATIARTALTHFNDVILRAGIDYGVDLIELRAICTEPADYANPIEPSGRGGAKIAAVIARWAAGDRGVSMVYR